MGCYFHRVQQVEVDAMVAAGLIPYPHRKAFLHNPSIFWMLEPKAYPFSYPLK